MRTILTRFLSAATVIGALLCAGVLGYGLVRGPPAPIRQVQEGYRDKYGNAYTAIEYERFLHWRRVLLASFAVTFALGFAWVAVERKPRRAGTLSPEERDRLDAVIQHLDRIMPDAAAELRSRGPLSRPVENPDPERTRRMT